MLPMTSVWPARTPRPARHGRPRRPSSDDFIRAPESATIASVLKRKVGPLTVNSSAVVVSGVAYHAIGEAERPLVHRPARRHADMPEMQPAGQFLHARSARPVRRRRWCVDDRRSAPSTLVATFPLAKHIGCRRSRADNSRLVSIPATTVRPAPASTWRSRHRASRPPTMILASIGS